MQAKQTQLDAKRAAQRPIYDSAVHTRPWLEELSQVIHYRNLVFQMTRRDILTRYKRSMLGIAWTMITPLGTMLVLTIVFSRAFGNSDPSYAAYVLSGLMPWLFFAQSTNAAIVHLVWGGNLLNRIYIPRTSFAISAIGTALVNLLISLVPLALVSLIVGVPLRWTWLVLPVPILFLVMFALGLGLFISAVAVYFSDIAEMYQVGLTAWLYLSPVIWTENQIPKNFVVWVVRLNPMYHLIQLFRAPIYEGRVPEPLELLIGGAIASITLAIGWFFFTRNADEFAYRL